MSQTKHIIEAAADALGVPVDRLTEWLMSGESVGDDLDERVAERTARDGIVREVVRDAAGAPLVILEHRGLSGQTASTFVRPAAELVSEDDYRGVAADLIARWADDHVDAATVLASLNLAAHGMPVTTPSRRALSRVRAALTPYADGSRRMASDDLARDVLAILDEVGA